MSPLFPPTEIIGKRLDSIILMCAIDKTIGVTKGQGPFLFSFVFLVNHQ